MILIFVLRDQAVGKQRGCGGGLDVDSCTCEEGSVSALPCFHGLGSTAPAMGTVHRDGGRGSKKKS